MSYRVIDYKTIFNSLKYVVPVLTFFSLAKFVYFYSQFNIQIGYYITLDELLIPFASDILFYSISIFLIWLISAVFVGPFFAQIHMQEFDAQRQQSFKTRFISDLKAGWYIVIVPVVLAAILIHNQKQIEFVLPLLFSPVLSIIYWVRREVLIKTEFEFNLVNVTYLNLSTFLMSMFIMLMLNTFIESRAVKDWKSNYIILETGSTTITCGDSIRYIGRTKEYTFLFNKNNQQSIIINNSSIAKTIIGK